MNYPEGALLRLSQIIGDLSATPPVLPIIPVKKSTWWAGVRSGRFPQPIKLGPRVTVWRASDINKWVKEAGCHG